MIASPSSRVELSDVQIVVADDSLIFLIHLLSFFIFTSLSPTLPQSCPGSGKNLFILSNPTLTCHQIKQV